MTLYLVRHAVAVRRSSWSGLERLRPLSGGGHRQAHRIVEFLKEAPVTRIVTSPHLRCRQTVEPLAARRGLPVEMDVRLRDRVSVEDALELLDMLREHDAVLCSHGDLVSGLIERLCEGGLRLRDEPLCEKGSLWVLEGGLRAPTATYVPPPAKKRRRDARSAGPGVAEPGEPRAELEREKARVAVLDLGSTSFHLLVADARPTGEIRRVLREREMLRLGHEIATGRHIPEAVCRRAVETARELRRHADDADASRLLPVATAALREAENGAELADRIGDAVGAPVRILSGEEEARLIFAAFRRRMALSPGVHMGVDLGGGSLEIAVGDDDVDWEATLRLGVVRLYGEFVRRDPMSAKQERAVRARVRELIAPCIPEIARRAPAFCVATGGTVSALARRIATRRTSWPTRAVGQLFIPRAELADLTRELVASTHDERLAMPGISKQRADLLPTGALVLDALADELGLDGYTVSDWGLREGVILESLGLAR